MPDNNYLFVYGTLLHSLKNQMADFVKQHSKPFSEGYFIGELYDLGEYPGAVLSENKNDKVWGQVFLLDSTSTVFSQLDEYEGISTRFSQPHLFVRKQVNVTTINDDTVNCWVYLYNLALASHVKIASGNYMEYLSKR